MMFKKTLIMGVIFGVLVLIAACAGPVITVVDERGEAPQAVEKSEAVAVEQEGAMIETVEAEQEVPAEEMMEEEVSSEEMMEQEVDLTNPKVNEMLNQVPLVQHHYDSETELTSFTCASRGLGLNAVETDPEGPRYVGPSAGDFDLWGIVALFKVDPDGSISLVPEQTGGKFVDPDGIEHDSFTLEEALGFFASGDAIWTGAHGEGGRVVECDPQYVKPTAAPD